jgi:SAM-dependent methyltransferase
VELTSAAEGRPRWAEIAYEAMAPVYDEFTHLNDYESWLGRLLPALERHGLRTGRVLDVGCGSGKAFAPMLRRGWSIHGCDVSPAMLKQAQEKGGADVRVDVADMRELPRFGGFELVWALNDPINYMLDPEEMKLALAGMRRNLGPEGLLLFDTNTLHGYRGFFCEEVAVERDGWRLSWHGHSKPDDPPGTVFEASFEAAPLADRDAVPIPPELHRERHFAVAEVLAALERVGLECLDVFGYTDEEGLVEPLDEAVHYKAIYIARAANQPPSASTP